MADFATPNASAAFAARNTTDGNAMRIADQAIMGAENGGTDNGNIVQPIEVIDESGVLIQQRFVEFLANFMDEDGSNENDNNELEDAAESSPYVKQARKMVQKLLFRLAPQSTLASEDVLGNDEANLNEVETTYLSGFAYTLFVDFQHIQVCDTELAEAIESDYNRFEYFLRRGVYQFIVERHPEIRNHVSHKSSYQFFVAMYNLSTVLPLRSLKMGTLCRLTSVTGTITRTTEVRPELLVGAFRCMSCGLLASTVIQQYHLTRPALCRNPRCRNTSPASFVLENQQCVFGDWQKLRVQENSDHIPPGCMPRTFDIMIRHEMVEHSKAGDKCVFTGCLVVLPDGSALARAGDAPRAVPGYGQNQDASNGGGGGVTGFAALGVKELTYRTCYIACTVLPIEVIQRTKQASLSTSAMVNMLSRQDNESMNYQEPNTEEVVKELTLSQREDIRRMRGTPNLYNLMAESLAPGTFGHIEVKKGLLLMLLGGIHKTTADRTKIRGDINVCIVGDPSTAKSQFLKYVHSFLPSRCIYTSGKASTAAGLTAAVQRDHDTGEFCIEAGALMLADNGICCIDEFDKMDPADQVAIHEAMEQQTITITKAGIQATLNARASVLAAANPIHGRYDRSKTLRANVALSAPILSRFDLFFVVLDDCNRNSDLQVARHIIRVHRCEDAEIRPPFSNEQVQRYIRVARTINPRMSNEAKQAIVACYRLLRQGDTLGRSRTSYRITVRQLESMIRLSEAKARLHFDSEIREAHVMEAFRLLKTSIIQVESSQVSIDELEGDEVDEKVATRNLDIPNPTISQSRGPIQVHPGEYTETATSKRKRKRVTRIAFDEYESVSNAIGAHLRLLEGKDGNDSTKRGYMKWHEIVDWYIQKFEQPELKDYPELLQETKKKINLVIRRILTVDSILVPIGAFPRTKADEQDTFLTTHPNYVVP